MTAPDKNIVSLAGSPAQDRVSLDDLYRHHGDWLRELIRRRLRIQPADAEDIVQDTYARAAHVAADTITHPRAFLVQIAFNLFRDRKRREAVRRAHAEAIGATAATEQAHNNAMAEQEAALQLERLVVEMPQPYRDVFVLTRFRQMTNREAASHLGVSIKTVEWRMSRALEFCVSRLRD